MIAPALQFLPQRAVALTRGMETELPMVTIREETSDEEGSDDTDDTGPDCKFLKCGWGLGNSVEEFRGKEKRGKEKRKGKGKRKKKKGKKKNKKEKSG